MAPSPALPAPAEGIELAQVEAAGQRLGIEIRCVREIIRSRPLTPLPRAPALIEGVMELRGSVIPVVDLSRALGGDAVCGGPRARIVVVELDDLVFGLRVTAAEDVIQVDPAQVEPPPTLAQQAGCQAARAVVRERDTAPLLVLSLEAIRDQVCGGGGLPAARAQAGPQ